MFSKTIKLMKREIFEFSNWNDHNGPWSRPLYPNYELGLIHLLNEDKCCEETGKTLSHSIGSSG